MTVSVDAMLDPITVEVLKNDLNSITEEMALVIIRTARSPLLKAGDSATAVADRQGRVMAAANPYGIHWYSVMLKNVLNQFADLAPGDAIMSNDPWAATSHLPDVAVIAPIFQGGELVGFSCTYSHHSDIGGRFGGGVSSLPSSIFEEGVRIPLMKIRAAGVINETALALLLANVRNPDEWRADMEAKLSACDAGNRGMLEMLDRHGVATFDSACEVMLDQAESEMRAQLSTIPDGVYEEQDRLHDDARDAWIELKVKLTVAGSEVTCDFTGSSPQVGSALNITLEKMGGVLQVICHSIGGKLPTNLGSYRPMHLVTPKGSVVNPQFPAAVGARATTRHFTTSMVERAVAKAIPDRAAVPSSGNALMQLAGGGATGTAFVLVDLLNSGWGGRVDRDGVDGIGWGMGGVMSAEVLERQYPVIIEGFGYVPDTEGAGRFRGALGVYRQWKFLQDGFAIVRRHQSVDAPGLNGGGPGKAGKAVYNPGMPDQRDLPKGHHLHIDVKAGDRLYLEATPSGGHSDALLREPAAVLFDVIEGKVSVAGAAERYGVVIAADGATVDGAATKERRDRMRAQRG